MSRKLSERFHSRPPLKVWLPHELLQRAAQRLVVALVDQVAAEAADLLVGQHAHVGGLEQHVVARLADRRRGRSLRRCACWR